MGKETCKVTFLNTRITSGNWCRAFRNDYGEGNVLGNTSKYISQLVSYF